MTSAPHLDQDAGWLPEEPFVFATVGTDHHKFDRLMLWIDDWCRETGCIPCVVQSGRSRPPPSARSRAFLPAETMRAAMTTALAVVCHGGPATIMEARSVGRLPIVVPRRRAFGEHVDDHQVWFTGRLAQLGEIALAEDQWSLFAQLERAMARPEDYMLTKQAADITATVQRFATAVEPLVRRRKPQQGCLPRRAERVETKP